MNQIAALLIPTAPPIAAGGIVPVANTAPHGQAFADLLAQFRTMLTVMGATTASNTPSEPTDAQTTSIAGVTPGSTAAGSTTTQTANVAGIASDNTPRASSQPHGLVDLLALLHAKGTGEPATSADADKTLATQDTSLSAQFAASQTALMNLQQQPNAKAAKQSSPQAPTTTELALRGTLVPQAAATKQTVQTPATIDEAALAALTTSPNKDRPTPLSQNAAKLAAAAKRAVAQPASGGAPQIQPADKTTKSADATTATAPAAQNTPAPSLQGATPQPQATSTDQPTQPAHPIVASSAAQTPTIVDARQLTTTVTATPQGAVPIDALAVNIARRFNEGASQFEIRLHPAELGRLDISLTVADDGHVQAVLRAERPETLDMLQRDARALEQQLRQAGLDVGSNALSFSLSGGNGQRQAPFTGWPAFADAQDVAGAAKEEAAAKYVAVRIRDGVDIRV